MLLYTEMVPVGTAATSEAFAGEVTDVGPLAVQLGGGSATALAAWAARAEDLGYTEVNLNCGCPSPAAVQGGFGAKLMGAPERVADAVAAMRAACRLPITVKHRIGIDDRDAFADLLGFVDVVAPAGCDRFVVHARKAVLTGWSPRANRERPPLRHADVHALKRARPQLRIDLNGGIASLDAVDEHLWIVDGVMIGRALYDDPMAFADADARLYGDVRSPITAEALAAWLLAYAHDWVARGGRLHDVTRHALHAFRGCPGARRFRRTLSTHARGSEVSLEGLRHALAGLFEERGTDDGRSPVAGRLRREADLADVAPSRDGT